MWQSHQKRKTNHEPNEEDRNKLAIGYRLSAIKSLLILKCVFLLAAIFCNSLAIGQGQKWSPSEVKESWKFAGCFLVKEKTNTILTGEFCGKNYDMHTNPHTNERASITERYFVNQINVKSPFDCINDSCGIYIYRFYPSNDRCEVRVVKFDGSRNVPNRILQELPKRKNECAGEDGDSAVSASRTTDRVDASRADQTRQARQMCEAQKQTCKAGCGPITYWNGRSYVDNPNYNSCDYRCSQISCN